MTGLRLRGGRCRRAARRPPPSRSANAAATRTTGLLESTKTHRACYCPAVDVCSFDINCECTFQRKSDPPPTGAASASAISPFDRRRHLGGHPQAQAGADYVQQQVVPAATRIETQPSYVQPGDYHGRRGVGTGSDSEVCWADC
ncbi:hypothetical protein PF011_g5586 [Phytophthora fragariae]|uniref:Uncharacterized protein n=1 Tax=Phytophthora fragariae TaxID=53985 RepID=A0A6A3LP00_9STRA|nr:hypothetical protein PF011_g5586 [Phytophthora fragariae]